MRRSAPGRLAVLTYHRIGAPAAGPPGLMSATPATFERQMRWLASTGRVVALADVLSAARGGATGVGARARLGRAPPPGRRGRHAGAALADAPAAASPAAGAAGRRDRRVGRRARAPHGLPDAGVRLPGWRHVR